MIEKSIWFGIVENRNDPLKMGRCQVRIFGVHSESKANVPSSDLPWATPLMPLTSASLSGIGHSPTGPVEGTLVAIQFLDPESKQVPVMLGTVPAIPKNRALGGEFGTSDIPNLDFGDDANMQVLTDGSGNTVTDGSGNPVMTETPELVQPPRVTPDTGSVQGELNIAKYIDKFGEIALVLKNECAAAGIKNPFTVNAILANIAKESAFRAREEGLRYTSVARLKTVFPSTFASLPDEEVAVFVNNPEGLANKVYGNKEGNLENEGFKYRGRGFLQVTFKNNYSALGQKIGVDLVNKPELLLDATVAAKASVQFFLNNVRLKQLNAYTSQAEAIRAITQTVVGKNINLEKSEIGAEQLEKVRQYATYGVVESAIAVVNDPINGTVTTSLQSKKSDEVTNPGANANGVVLSPVTGSGDTGFSDPNGVYPKYFNEQDVNRLARNEKRNLTIVPEKEQFLKSIKDIPRANNKGTWSAPEDPYNAKYPYNHVYQSESGHVFEFDDTPGNERINLYHKKGSYVEYDSNGTQINRIVGDKYEILERNGFLKVFGNVTIQVDGDANIVVNNDCDLQVDGDMTAVIGNDLKADISGSANISVAEQAYVKAEEIRLESYASNFEITSAGNMNIQCAGNFNVKSAGAVNIESATATNIKTAGSTMIDSAGQNNLKSGGDFNFDASAVWMNSGKSAGANAAEPAIAAGLVTPGLRPNASPIEFAQLTTPPKNFEELSVFEDSDAPESYKFELQRKGLIDEDPQPAVIGEATKIVPSILPETSSVGVDCSIFINQVDIPMSLQLSKTIKLADLCQNGTRKIRPIDGVSEGQIVCNLKHLAVNVIDYVKSRYNVIITSAYRTGTGRSQHLRGQAADFVFVGKTPAQVIEIAKELSKSIQFDQMILEYLPSKRVANNQPTTWLHISYRADGSNRRQVFTMSNHSVLANSSRTGELILVS